MQIAIIGAGFSGCQLTSSYPPPGAVRILLLTAPTFRRGGMRQARSLLLRVH
jgi:hypothetical protein